MNYFNTPVYIFMPVIFFVYGMSFLTLGTTVAAERLFNIKGVDKSRDPESSPLWFLAVFGITHGLAEFVGMYSVLNNGLPLSPNVMRLVLLSVSYFFLFKFGFSYGKKSAGHGRSSDLGHMLPTVPPGRNILTWFSLPNIILGIWVVLCLVLLIRKGPNREWFTFSEILSRYFIGVPGALLASFAIWSSAEIQRPALNKYRMTASMSFAVYAMGTLVVPGVDIFPASLLNYETFYRSVHVPAAVLRIVCALTATFSLLQLFRLSKDFWGIRIKAVMHAIIAVSIPTFCLVLLVCYLVGNAFLRFSYLENEKLASMIAGKIWSLVDDTTDTVKDSLMSSRLAPASKKKDILFSMVRGNAAVTGIAFIDGEGELLNISRDPVSASVSYRGTTDNARISKFLEGLAPGLSGDYYYVSGHDKNNIIVTIPLSESRVNVLLNIEKIYSEATLEGTEKGWRTLLLDAGGKVFFPQPGLLPGRTEAREELSPRSTGIYARKAIRNGVYYNLVEGKIHSTDWSVIIEIPRRDIAAPIFGLFKAILFGVLAVNLLAVFVTGLFVGRVTKRIGLIARRVISVGRDEFDQVLKLRTKDELQTLSEEVEKMVLLIEEKKRMDKQINQTEKIASLGRLVAGVAHEINNPLGIILGYSQLLLRECEPQSRLCVDLRIVEKHTLACKKIVEDLLEFSRSNKQVKEVDITASIRETISQVEKHVLKENVSIKLQADPELPRILGDPDKLHQLFMNLALNALDSMNNGGSLTVSVVPLASEEGPGVEISFKDTGKGISERDIDRIFEPFFTKKKVGKGTGLGLFYHTELLRTMAERFGLRAKREEAPFSILPFLP